MKNIHISLTEFRNESRVIKEVTSLRDRKIFEDFIIVALGANDLPNYLNMEPNIRVVRFALKTRSLPKNIFFQFFKFIEFSIRCLGFLNRERPNVLNIHSLALLPIGWLGKLFWHYRLVYDTHELETEKYGLSGIRQKIAKSIERSFIHSCDLVIVVSERIADWYEKEYGISRPLVVLNVSRKQALKYYNHFREKLGIREDQTILLYQGGLSKGRGVDLILEAFKARKDDAIVAVFLGYGELGKAIQNAAVHHDNIFFYPAVSPGIVLEYTSSADIGIHLIQKTCLNHDYCMPNKLFEYAMAGLPVLVSDMKDMSAIVTKNKMGAIISDFSASGINQAIDNFLSQDLRKMRTKAHRFACKNSWELQETNLFAAYNKILQVNEENKDLESTEMNTFWKNVASVLTGTATAQSIPILGSLLIARLYTPVAYGAYAAWLGAVLILAVVLTGRFETALAIEEDGEPRRRGVVATLLTSLATACTAAIGLAVLLALVPSLWQSIPMPLIIIAIPTALAIAAVQIWISWAAAEAYYTRLSLMRIVQAASITVCQIGAGIVFKSAESLAVAYLVGICIAMGFSSWIMPLKKSDFHSMRRTLRWFWRRHRRFPLFSLPADSINTASAQLPIFIITHRFGAEISGFLALTLRALGAPIGLLGSSVLDVFKRHAATSYRLRGECSTEYIQTFKILVLGSLIFCAAMFFASEWLFTIAFGEKWRPSGSMAVWLLPLFAMRFIASPLSYMAYIAGKQHWDLLWQMGLLVLTYLTLTLNASYGDALKIYSFGYALLYIIYLWMSYRFSFGK